MKTSETKLRSLAVRSPDILWITSLLFAITLTFLSAPAFAQIIDFEGFAKGTRIDTEYQSSLGVTINGVNVDQGNAQNMAVIFDTNNPTGGDTDLGGPFSNDHGLGNLSPGNVLIIHEHPSECVPNPLSCGDDPDDEGSRPAGFFEITFSTGVRLDSIDFFDVEAAENGTNPANAITLFDSNGNELSPNTFFTPNTGGDNKWHRLNFGVSDVASLTIRLNGSGAIDNINYYVPEPSSTLLLGLGIAGLVWTRRKAQLISCH